MTGTLSAAPHLIQGWALAAAALDVAEAGSYVTCDVELTPLIVIRGHDGLLRAFVNMCRHRGMALLQGCGQVEATITCPYHAWRFDTDGRLRVIAQRAAQFPDVDSSAWGLLPASVAEAAGLVFVHAQADAAPLTNELWSELAHTTQSTVRGTA